MAAPPEITIDNLQGTWRMNKTLSDSMDSALELQGMPWIIRKAVSFATITGRLSQKKDESGVTVIQVAQTATGGIKGETEIYRLDGSETTQGSGMFGVQKIRTRWLDLSIGENGDESSVPTNLAGQPTYPWLLQGWLKEASINSPGHINALVINEKAGWTTEQLWGFSMIEGSRRRVTKFLISKGSDVVKMRVVYDWLGSDR
ncbi:hypothetical protein HD806DRAFT_550204 [Xylariaceae sp. AK1471]|nr:hypothetical protein HD806DRAFT_550204 [Xylariaceae sp. AK1471]